MRRVWISLSGLTAGIALALLAGCQTVRTTEPGVVGVDRQQRMLISREEMDRGSAEAYQKIIQDAQKKGALNRNAAYVERVRRIVARLTPVTAAFRADAPRWRWEVNVLTSDEINAWCMAGGKVAVYTGLIDKLKITDDELAAVMGHEIAHALREHSREQASREAGQNMIISLGSALLGAPEVGQQVAQLATDVLFNRPHSRDDETEADRIGVELAARAGYDPRAAVSLWQKMGAQGGATPPQWLSTHPSPQTRTRDLQDYAQRVLPLYQAAVKR